MGIFEAPVKRKAGEKQIINKETVRRNSLQINFS